jgi:cysteine desulfurase/selenocysteine lyase
VTTARPLPSRPAAALSYDLERIREDFPILKQTMHGKPLVYLDNAATSQKPQSVIDALVQYYSEYNANVHRSVYAIAEQATAGYEAARVALASFIGARRSEEIIFTRSTTEAINLVAYSWGRANIRQGDEIVLTEMEHHSNIVPWQILAQEKGAKLVYLQIDGQGRLVLDDLDQKITRRTKLVALTLMSNVLGTINPVHEIAQAAHAVGALVLVDGAQGVPHLRADVKELDCDFLAFSGHKMCGPTGIGALWGRYEVLDAMPPFHGGGEMILRVEHDYSTYREPPLKFEAGTPNIADAIVWKTAMDYLSNIGMDAVRAHEIDMVTYALKRLPEVEGITIYGPGNPEERGGAVAFTLEGIHPHDIAQVLDQEGIAIRAGHHCTQPLHECLLAEATARASFYLYNIPEEVDLLVNSLHKVRELFPLHEVSK